MAVTLMDIQKLILNLLNETYDSPALDLRAGAAGGATIVGITPASSSTASTAKTLINKCSAELAQSCVPIPDTGTYSWTIGLRSKPFTAFTPATTGNVLWTVRGASFAGTQLRFVSRSAIERHDPAWMTTTGTPTDWYFDGGQAIGLYPLPSTNNTVKIDGFVVPAPLVADTDTVSWLPDNLALHLHAWYVADMVARKNMEDQALAARSDDWREWRFLYDNACQDLWSKVPVSIRSYLYPTPPIAARPSPGGIVGAAQ